MTQRDKADLFRSLHQAGDPLVLYNIWDAGGARVLGEAGAKAVATGSWSVAAAHGYADGEAIPLDFVLRIAGRIAATTDLPLSLDFEGGYAEDPAVLEVNARQVIRAGAVGVNFEDRVVGGQGLYPVDRQAARIGALRAAARKDDMPLFINARTDIFLGADPADHAGAMPEAIERAAAYAAAGADGFFVPGLTEPALIKRIVEATDLPVNVMMRGGLTSLAEVAGLGVARASYGPGPYAAAMEDLAARFRALR